MPDIPETVECDIVQFPEHLWRLFKHRIQQTDRQTVLLWSRPLLANPRFESIESRLCFNSRPYDKPCQFLWDGGSLRNRARDHSAKRDKKFVLTPAMASALHGRDLPT